MALKLDPDEKIVSEAGLSFWLFLPSLFVLTVTLFGAAFLFFSEPVLKYQGLLTLTFVTVFVVVGLRLYIIFMSTSIILTTRRLVFAKGFLHRQVQELYLTRIEGINIRQSLNARLMGFGTVEASGVGSEIAPIDGIASPWVFHKAVSEAMQIAMDGEPPQPGTGQRAKGPPSKMTMPKTAGRKA